MMQPVISVLNVLQAQTPRIQPHIILQGLYFSRCLDQLMSFISQCSMTLIHLIFKKLQLRELQPGFIEIQADGGLRGRCGESKGEITQLLWEELLPLKLTLGSSLS